MPPSVVFRAVHWQPPIAVLLCLLLTACDGGYANLPNIRTDRTDTSLINYLPISLKEKAPTRSTGSEGSMTLSKLRNNSLNRLSNTSDAVSRSGEEAHTLTHTFIAENAKVHTDRANKILRTRDSLSTIQTALEEHCSHISTGEDCKLAEAALDMEVLSTAFGYLPSNEVWQPYEQEAVFVHGTGKPLNFRVTITFNLDSDFISVSVGWNQELSVLEESLHTRWITSDSVREYKHTFGYDDNQTSSFNASGSINDSRFSISQDLNRTNSDLNDITLRTLAMWNTQTEQGRLKIDITANDDNVQSLSSFDNQVDGARYASMTENIFDSDGKLTSRLYCIGSTDSGCSTRNGWIQSVQSTAQ